MQRCHSWVQFPSFTRTTLRLIMTLLNLLCAWLCNRQVYVHSGNTLQYNDLSFSPFGIKTRWCLLVIAHSICWKRLAHTKICWMYYHHLGWRIFYLAVCVCEVAKMKWIYYLWDWQPHGVKWCRKWKWLLSSTNRSRIHQSYPMPVLHPTHLRVLNSLCVKPTTSKQ